MPIILAVVVVAAGLVLSSILSNQKEPMRRHPAAMNRKPLGVIDVENRELSAKFEVTGHLTAFDKVELFAEVSGVLLETEKRFKEGTRFERGEVLIHIDDAVYRNNVLAQKSQLLNQLTLLLPDFSIDFPDRVTAWEQYLHRFDIDAALAPLPEVKSDQERYYIASRDIYNKYFLVKSMEETWAKYTLEAPFNGVVSSSNINPGTLVRAGQKLGEFTNTRLYELAAPVSVRHIPHLRVGQPVSLISEDVAGEFQGKIQRINEVIDPQTQTVKIYITARDPRLRDGMFLTARLTSKPIEGAVRIPSTLLVRGDRVYAVAEDSTLYLEEVVVADEENGHSLVQGLEDGTRLIAERLIDAFEGQKVRLAPSPPGRGGE